MAGLQDGRALSAAHAVGPAGRQAAQPARPQPACRAPPRSRAASRSPCIPRTPPRAASPTATSCACSTTAAPASRRRGSATASAAAWCGCRPAPGSIRPTSGSNRPLEKHGNPNALTLDIGASKLEPGLHRPDLPGRDRALRRAGAGGDGARPAALRQARGVPVPKDPDAEDRLRQKCHTWLFTSREGIPTSGQAGRRTGHETAGWLRNVNAISGNPMKMLYPCLRGGAAG